MTDRQRQEVPRPPAPPGAQVFIDSKRPRGPYCGMSLAKQTDRCPYCRETIVAGATKCPHCHSELSAAPSRKTSFFARFNTFRIGFVTGIAFCLILALLIYIQLHLNR